MTVKDIRPGLRAFLLADASISTAVGASRIYPMLLPQGVITDSIVYQRISAQNELNNSGPDGLARPRMQLDCWSKTANGAVALALLVKDRVEGYRGVMGSGGDAVTVQAVIPDNEREDYDDTAKMFRVSLDYFIWYVER